MSNNPPPEPKSLFETALNEFEKRAGTNLVQHPIIDKLVNCESADSVIDVLQEQAQAFQSFRGGDGKLMTWLKRTVDVLYALSTSDVINGVISSPFPPASAIFAGIAILLGTIKNITSTSYDALVELFESFESFLKRLDIYTKIPSTTAMSEIIVKIFIELLSTIAFAIQQAKQGRLKKLGKKLLGEDDVEAVLQRLDRLTREEAQTTATQTLELVYGLVKNIGVVMDGGSVLMDDVHQTLVRIQQLASGINKSRRNELQEKFRRWLSPPDPSKNHNTAREAHLEGSAEWFVDGNTYSEWKRTDSLLWIHGKPGSGKTVLSSTIIEDIMRQRQAGLASIAYFYFDFRDSLKQDVYGALSSLLTQLSAQSDAYCHILEHLYFDLCTKRDPKPSKNALRECLKSMLKLQDQGPIFIILDAIDECPSSAGAPSPRDNVLEFVKWLSELHYSHVSICVTSRPETDIEAVLEPLASHTISLHTESGQNEDIANYIKWFINSDPKAQKWRKEDKELVLEKLLERADGMYTWVFCQLDKLRRCLFSPRLRQALDELPDTLDETYERTLRDIDEGLWAYAHRLFQCITVARRPLRVEELTAFLAFKSETGGGLTFQGDWRPKNPKDMVLSTCSSLVAVIDVDGSAVIQFSHYSVKEYLISSRIAEGRVSRYYIPLEPAHLFVTQACLCFLLQLDNHVTKTSIEELSLARYAGQYWTDHAEFGNASLDAEDSIKRLFNPKDHHFAIWVWIYDPIPSRHQSIQSERPSLPNLAPLHYAAYCGFHRVAEWLITTCSKGIDLSRRYSNTPLHIASEKGRFSVAQVLLTHHQHAKVNAINDSETTALHLASTNGHFKVVRLLVEHGAAVHYGPDCGVTPLHATVLSFLVGEDEKLEVAQVLLEYGADPKTRTLLGTDSLYLALMKDHKRLVQLLLKHGADPNTRGVDGQTSLHISCGSGDLNVTQGLLDLRVDVNPRDNSDQIPLHKALLSKDAKTVKLLLKHGAKLT